MKSSLGIDTTSESIFILHTVADDDGSLKIKKLEDFHDSKAFSEIHKALMAAIAAAQANK